jgi:flagellar basal-body rod protein FlgB
VTGLRQELRQSADPASGIVRDGEIPASAGEVGAGTRFDEEASAMFIERMMNQTSAPLVERVLEFAAARHRLIAENMANIDTPGYRQKDLSSAKFFSMLRARAAERAQGAPGAIGYDDIATDLENPVAGILFHDQNNRSMEQLASEQAKNGLLYTMAIEILRKQYSQMEMALKERVS